MSEPLPRRPVPPGVTDPQGLRAPLAGALLQHRRRRLRGGRTRDGFSPVGWVAVLVVVVMPLGAGAVSARVLPGPGAGTGTAPVTTAFPAPPGARSGAPAQRPGPATGAWPLRPEPEVVADFAPPPVAWSAGHRGVDLLGRPGEPVRAAKAGTVTFAGRIAGRGVVVVSHGDTRTTYEPVAAAVHRGESVRQGEVIGELELLGSHCLPRACLHWGLVRGETYLDPLTLVGRGPVRLVPWGGLPALPWS